MLHLSVVETFDKSVPDGEGGCLVTVFLTEGVSVFRQSVFQMSNNRSLNWLYVFRRVILHDLPSCNVHKTILRQFLTFSLQIQIYIKIIFFLNDFNFLQNQLLKILYFILNFKITLNKKYMNYFKLFWKYVIQIPFRGDLLTENLENQ